MLFALLYRVTFRIDSFGQRCVATPPASTSTFAICDRFDERYCFEVMLAVTVVVMVVVVVMMMMTIDYDDDDDNDDDDDDDNDDDDDHHDDNNYGKLSVGILFVIYSVLPKIAISRCGS
jgi:hypothetical protein